MTDQTVMEGGTATRQPIDSFANVSRSGCQSAGAYIRIG
jgi:hypothetical protein